MGPLAEYLGRGEHLFPADLEALVGTLKPLPGQTTLEKEEEGVGEGLEVIPPARRPAQMRMDAA